MPYRRTVLVEKQFYHIFNRGVAKQPIFIDDQDRFVFLKKINQYRLRKTALKPLPFVSIHCFCLMPNHFHMIVRQELEKGITDFIRKAGTAYSMYFNNKYNRVGPLFQGRFKAKLIDKNEYIIHLARYIHLNPLSLVESFERLCLYPFTSLSGFLSHRDFPFLERSFIMDYFQKKPDELLRFTRSHLALPQSEVLKPYLFD